MFATIVILAIVLGFIGLGLFIKNKAQSRALAAIARATGGTPPAPVPPAPAGSTPPPSGGGTPAPKWKKRLRIGAWVVGVILIISLLFWIGSTVSEYIDTNDKAEAVSQQLKADNPDLTDDQLEEKVRGALKKVGKGASKQASEWHVKRFVPLAIGLLVFGFGLYLLTKNWGAKFVGFILLAGTALLFLSHMQWLDPFEEAMNAAVSETPVEINSSETSGIASQEEASTTETTSSKAGVQNRSIFDKPEPIEKDFQLKSLDGGELCGLPPGKHVITAEQTQLIVTDKISRKEYTIKSILGGLFGEPLISLPYKEKNMEWAVLFNKKPAGSEVTIQKSGCIVIALNISALQKGATGYTLTKPVSISITVQ